MRYPAWLVLGLVLLSIPAVAAEAPLLEIQRQTDRSAIWVGDRFRYKIVVLHAPQVRFVTDNLQERSVNLHPFEILDLQYSQRPAVAGRRILEVQLLLTTYEPSPGQLQIPAFNLFYFVDSATVTASADRPAEILAIPPTPMVLRSTLPEEVSSLRDEVAPPATPLRHRVAGYLAAALVLLVMGLTVPVFLQGRKLRAAQELSRRRREARELFRNSLLRLAERQVASESQVLEFYESLHQNLRQFLAAVSFVPTEGKTGQEMAALLSKGVISTDGLLQAALREIPALLETCDHVRYAPDTAVLGAQQHSSVVERLRAIAGSRE